LAKNLNEKNTNSKGRKLSDSLYRSNNQITDNLIYFY